MTAAIIDRMTATHILAGRCTQSALPRKNPLSPKKLLLSKWTAVSPAGKEKHFVVTRVVKPEPPNVRVEWVEVEAVHSGRSSMMQWRDLTDSIRWRQGWV